MIEKSTADFLGWFHFRPGKGAPVDEPDLGYRLRKSAWGKGYATEGSRALIEKGFTELGVRRVVASTMAVNTRSRRVMEKAGLIFVRGTTRTGRTRRGRGGKERGVRDRAGRLGQEQGKAKSGGGGRCRRPIVTP